ncbi:hypothetical protein Tco_1228550 [Tanacetum coccineum]
MDTKFAKASILGKPPLQPSRNHLVVRQPNAFTSERPRMSRPRFASQVDEKNDLSKTVTPQLICLKYRESAATKLIKNARKMTQDKTRIPNHRDMASTRAHCTPNACTPKPRNIYRSSLLDLSVGGGMSNIVYRLERNPSPKIYKKVQKNPIFLQFPVDISRTKLPLKESKKMSKRQPGTRGSNEGTGNILGVPDESTVISRASSEGTGSKPGVPDEEKLIL